VSLYNIATSISGISSFTSGKHHWEFLDEFTSKQEHFEKAKTSLDTQLYGLDEGFIIAIRM
jgi:hypothetical protein